MSTHHSLEGTMDQQLKGKRAGNQIPALSLQAQLVLEIGSGKVEIAFQEVTQVVGHTTGRHEKIERNYPSGRN